MRSLRLGGMSVTMPHKTAVAAVVDTITPRAERLILTLYWLLFCLLLAVATVLFWPRGRHDRWRARRHAAAVRVQQAELQHGGRVSLGGRLLEPFARRRIVSRHATAVRVQ